MCCTGLCNTSCAYQQRGQDAEAIEDTIRAYHDSADDTVYICMAATWGVATHMCWGQRDGNRANVATQQAD